VIIPRVQATVVPPVDPASGGVLDVAEADERAEVEDRGAGALQAWRKALQALIADTAFPFHPR
jgi:hypothetical protein